MWAIPLAVFVLCAQSSLPRGEAVDDVSTCADGSGAVCSQSNNEESASLVQLRRQKEFSNASEHRSASSATSLPACRGSLIYGTQVVIENQYSGHYWLERNVRPSFTTSWDRIDDKAALWKIRSPLKPGSGVVNYGDEVRLENQYAGHYWLQRNVVPAFTTKTSRVRTKAATWKIHDSNGNPSSGAVGCNDVVTFVNQYPGHYFLERNGRPSFTTSKSRISMNAARWKMKPVCVNTAGGFWKPRQVFHLNAGVGVEIHVGVKDVESIADTEGWQAGVSASITAGYSAAVVAAGAHASVTVTGSYTRTAARSVTRAYERTWSKKTTINPLVSGQLWQFSFDTSSACGDNEIDTETYMITPNLQQPPCCPPGMHVDTDIPTGSCISDMVYMCG